MHNNKQGSNIRCYNIAMQQYKLDYLLFADAASVDNFGKLNLLGIFQNISLPKVPGRILKFTLVCSISVKNPDKSFKVEIKIKDEKENFVISKQPLVFNFNPQVDNKDNRVNLIIELVGLEFKNFGDYEVEVYVNDEKIGSSYLKVQERPKKTK